MCLLSESNHFPILLLDSWSIKRSERASDSESDILSIINLEDVHYDKDICEKPRRPSLSKPIEELHGRTRVVFFQEVADNMYAGLCFCCLESPLSLCEKHEEINREFGS